MDRGFIPEDLKLHTGSEWIKSSQIWQDNTVPLKWYFTQSLSFGNETPSSLCALYFHKKKNKKKTTYIQMDTEGDFAAWV